MAGAGALYGATRRALDVAGASLGLVLLSPLLLGAAAAIRLTMGPPVLFRQQRPGLHGEPFTLLKFRTMRPASEGPRTVADDGARITRLGALLRASSIDELPELWNVLRGDMSLVGPRPLLMQYLPLYTERQRRRHDVRPGITGYVQVNGRNALSWDERFELDVWYVENRSLWLDLRILLQTVGAVVARKGISHPGHATMPPFTGAPPGPSLDQR